MIGRHLATLALPLLCCAWIGGALADTARTVDIEDVLGPMEFEEVVELVAEASLDKTQDQEDVDHIIGHVMEILRDEWGKLLELDLPPDQTFDGSRRLERLVVTAKELSEAEHNELYIIFHDRLLDMLDEDLESSPPQTGGGGGVGYLWSSWEKVSSFMGSLFYAGTVNTVSGSNREALIMAAQNIVAQLKPGTEAPTPDLG